MIQLTKNPIHPASVIDKVRREGQGAVVTFIGTVRGHSRGKKVLYLEYEAFTAMAERKLGQIADEIRNQWDLDQVAICHRTGRLEVGETILVIAVAAPHRRQAFEACQYAIDRLKQIVPIWKKEVWADGEAWVGWEGTSHEEA